MAREFFVISRDEKRAERWRQMHPRLSHPFEVRGCSVEEITRNEDHIGSQPQEHVDDALGETAAADMSKVHVAYQGSHSRPPTFREDRQFHGNSPHANPKGIDDGV